MSSEIRFAFRPAELKPEFIGSCTGYHPAGCGDQGYASCARLEPLKTAFSAAPLLRLWRPPLNLTVKRALGSLVGTDDIYFLEACMYSTICANGAELFSEDLQVGDVFHCQLHEAGFNQLRDWVLASA